MTAFLLKKKRNPQKHVKIKKKQRPESPKVGRAAMDMTLGFQRRPALHQPRRLHLGPVKFWQNDTVAFLLLFDN